MNISESDAYPILQDMLTQTASLSGEAFLHEMTRLIAATFHADRVFIAQAVGQPPREARVVAACHASGRLEAWSYALAEAPCQALYAVPAEPGGSRLSGPVVLTTPSADEGTPARRYIGVPLYGEDATTLGHIAVIFEDEASATTDGFPILELLQLIACRTQAELSRVLMESEREHMLTKLAELSTQLQNESISDFLTGLYNRRYFTQRIKEAYARYQRAGENYALIVLDVDHFNQLNEDYGHDIGDHVLRELGKILLDSTRLNVEVVFRLGDEEFAILCHGPIRSDGLRNLGNRINRAVRNHRFGPPGQSIDVTVSLGATLPRTVDASWDTIHKRADAAMHAAKQQGRDRTVVDG